MLTRNEKGENGWSTWDLWTNKTFCLAFVVFCKFYAVPEKSMTCEENG